MVAFLRLLRYNIMDCQQGGKTLTENKRYRKLSFKEQILRDLERVKEQDRRRKK